ncbi:MAG: amylo-alpha-1,6-glucosidase [Planctomycetota bacterium]|nr:MAG: amylo-alpha-1,6-glucosidase [Planctomycetota bacterium]
MPHQKDLTMHPAPGSWRVCYAGERLRISLSLPEEQREGQAYLRCNLGGDAHADDRLDAWQRTASWDDLPMRFEDNQWVIEVPLLKPGSFQAKALLVDDSGQRHWPEGENMGIVVHPATWRSGNTIYCTFPRMHGESRFQRHTRDSLRDEQLAVMDKHGWTVIPPSGTLRDLKRDIPHIVERLGCRIVHLLPINPTPTTHARYGRFGSPYAATDFTAIDQALIEHDRCTTGLDQFAELVDSIHGHGARLIIDLAINHTGWNSTLQNEHPQWFKRDEKGGFISPGAWGTIWEDLSELDHHQEALWDHLAEVFLTWCRRGVDGFRCDAGYMVPLPAWQRITDRVRRIFPDTLFLLEGLGGGWHDTASLLRKGGMQWAYSELFQNFGGHEVGPYLDHCLQAARDTGLLVHYSETHDNARLAARFPDRDAGRAWSLLRNRLCACTSVAGGFAFTAGVEWLADEKLEVHQSRGLNWDADDHIIEELHTLTSLCREHPCFFEDATLTRISPVDHCCYALHRQHDTDHHLIILANLDGERSHDWIVPQHFAEIFTHNSCDLLGSALQLERKKSHLHITLAPWQVICLSPRSWEPSASGRQRRANQQWAAAALQALSRQLQLRDFGQGDSLALGTLLRDDPERFLGALPHIDRPQARVDLIQAVQEAMHGGNYPAVTTWASSDHPRITVIPDHHWLLVKHHARFRVHLIHHRQESHFSSLPIDEHNHAVLIPPQHVGEAILHLHTPLSNRAIHGHLRYCDTFHWPGSPLPVHDMALLHNGRGGMARLWVDLGQVHSKYDAALAANLHPQWPVDRHVFIKRLRAWADVDGFPAALDRHTLSAFSNDHEIAQWDFRVGCGGGRWVDIHLQVWMPPGANALVCRWWRGGGDTTASLTITVRPDLEDRSFHSETQRNPESEAHFRSHLHLRDKGSGIAFTPSEDRQLHIICPPDSWHPDEEWSHCAHPLEATRGQTAAGDTWSPGCIRHPLQPGAEQTIIFNAEHHDIDTTPPPRPLPAGGLAERLGQALSAYLVQREDGRTVIAGYPWFLDWGRDTLICARGYLAAGHYQAVHDILKVFGRFEEQGTLPNIIHGDDIGNRDTVDAPLWYGVVAEELMAAIDHDILDQDLGRGRSLREVLISIACGYRDGTSHGVYCDTDSGLIWSPSHFTWMDTNYPAGTPRRGYPIEIQALWIRLLQLVENIAPNNQRQAWQDLRQRASDSLDSMYWLPQQGWWADCLIAEKGLPAHKAVRDTALRSNVVMAIALDVLHGERARSTLRAVEQHLVVPGALRSLAPLPVQPGLPIRDAQGNLLGDPLFPYRGRYEGDEDSQRKPAYHNGTAWTWTFPGFCEALVKAWPNDRQALQAARAYLSSIGHLLERGCLGHMPEIVDGNEPHQHRGCDAQAWGSSEALRVWSLLDALER